MNTKELVLEIRYDGKMEAHKSMFAKDDKAFDELIQLVLNHEPYPVEEYASWVLTHLCKENPNRLQPYYNDFVDCCFETENQSVLRNIVNIIWHLEITEYKESEFIDLLIGFINNPKNKVALHVYSIYTLVHFIKKYSELKDEITEVIELNSKEKSAAYRIAKRNFYKETEKI